MDAKEARKITNDAVKEKKKNMFRDLIDHIESAAWSGDNEKLFSRHFIDKKCREKLVKMGYKVYEECHDGTQVYRVIW